MKIKYSSVIHLFLFSAIIGSSVGYSHLYLFHICLIILIIGWLILTLNGKKNLFIKPDIALPGFFLIMLFWYSLSLIWSIKPTYTLQYIAYIFLGVTIVFTIIGRVVSEINYISIFNTIKWAFVLEIVIAMLEAFTPFRLPTSPFSEFAELFGRKATNFDLFQSNAVVYIKSMPTGFHGNPNNLAVVMASIMPFFLFHPKLIYKLTGSSCILIIIIMAGSRGAFIAAIFGIVLYAAITNFKRFLVLFFAGILTLSILLTGIDKLKQFDNKRIAEFAYTADVLLKYMTENEEMGTDSISVRKQLIKNGIDALYATNGLGVGGGGNQAVQEQLGGVQGKITSMHNFWIEILVDSGLGFFLIFAIWYLSVSFKLLSIYSKSILPFYKYHAGSLFVSFSIFSIACISASSVIYLLPMWIMFGMGLAVINLWYKRCSVLRFLKVDTNNGVSAI